MVEAFSEQLITIDELRAKMPHLRAREQNLRSQLNALDAQAADRDAYLKLADDLEGFLARLRSTAATASTDDRRRVLRLLVKDVLIGPDKITIRHRIPVREQAGSGSGHHDTTNTEGDMRQSYELCWGRARPGLGSGAEPHPVLYSERRTVKVRNLAADPRVVVHLVSAEDVVIVRATAEDLGTPARVPEVLAALSAKYTGEQDRQYLPDADPDFDIIYAIRPQSAMMWRLADYEGSQRRWTS